MRLARTEGGKKKTRWQSRFRRGDSPMTSNIMRKDAYRNHKIKKKEKKEMST